MSENTQDPREQLIEALQHHDWFYEYSDDSRAWAKGDQRRKLIQALIAKVPDGRELYEQYRPKR